jgi:N-methylhydantoinase B
VAAEEAWILHGTAGLDTQIYNNESFAKCQGLLGGNPGGRAFFRLKSGSDVRQRLAAGTIPQDLGDVAGEEVPLYWKGAAISLEPGSVWTTDLPNFAGYGDPLGRDADLVQRDVVEGRLTSAEALEVYGAVVSAEGLVDVERTAAERAGRRRVRLDGAQAAKDLPQVETQPMEAGEPEAKSGPGRRVAITEDLQAEPMPEGARYSCACGRDLGPTTSNLKEACRVRESPVDSIGPGYTSFATEMMAKMCFREFFCPGCGARLATEIARRGDGYLWDIELRL